MPRPRKCRKVCRMPLVQEFSPQGISSEEQAVVMTVDEYETIRLIDYEGFSQEECSEYMHVARTTVQAIYNEARHKIARALVNARPLAIRGGDYRLCDGEEEFCGCGGCQKHRRARLQQYHQTGGKTMIIAIPLDENRKDICPSFGRAPFYLFHNSEENRTDILENPAAQAHGGAGIQAAQFIVDQGAGVLVTPRCGENAAEVLRAAEISIYKSEGSDAAENIAAMQEGRLFPLTKFHAGFHGHR